MATGSSTDESIHLKKGEQESALTQKQIERMISYLSENTDYKILTNEEYKHLACIPMASSTLTAGAGARPKSHSVKFEQSEEIPLQTSHSDSCSAILVESSAVRPRFSVFSGEEKSETSFDVWKNDVQCALRDGGCSANIILQAIRSSLKGKARSLLLTLPTDATPEQILNKLDGVYGNIYPSEKLLQQFYTSKQEVGESVVDYGMRLEGLIQRCIERKAINNDVKNEMLRTKLWSGLSDSNLRNASRYKYDTIDDFETSRKELRSIELDLKLSASSSSSSSSSVSEKRKAQISKIGQGDEESSLDLILRKLDAIEKRIGDVEREVKQSNAKNQLPQNTYQSNSRYYDNAANRERGKGYKSFTKNRGQFRGHKGGATDGSSYPNKGYGKYRSDPQDLNQ